MRAVVAMVAVVVLCASAPTFGEEKEKPAKEELKSPAARLGYALGMYIGESLKTIRKELDLRLFLRGVEDTLEGKKPLLTQKEAGLVRQEFSMRMNKRRIAEKSKLAEKNQKEGEEFLAANKKKEGVVTTASGLQYVVLKEGDGPKPTTTDRVRVDYRGTLLDGTEFDSSYSRGKPAVFVVTGVIPGWTEALQLMKVGSKYKLFIPSNLAYGQRGAGPQIGPNATLIFEVELLGIEK